MFRKLSKFKFLRTVIPHRSIFRFKKSPIEIENALDGLKQIYKSKLLPLEETYLFHDFHSPKLNDADFDSQPMVLLMGQYSTGKTTLIKYLLGTDFPGIRIGPEPTTDRFIVVMYGDQENTIPGNALVVDPTKQFTPLSKFGNAFLNRFQCSTVCSPVLKSISVIDTPGILSGEKQRVDRGYDFTGVLKWFAERVDRIILIFDAHKLDISDEFRRSIEGLHGHDDKIRIILNKADRVDHQQLMRVYGALMWSLGKILMTPEVARVYIGSFWDEPLIHDLNRSASMNFIPDTGVVLCSSRLALYALPTDTPSSWTNHVERLFEDEERDLFKDIQHLPRNAVIRKLNDLTKRARLAKVHAYIISNLKNEMPNFFKKNTKKAELIYNLGDVYRELERKHLMSPGDFPDLKKMQEQLVNHDFTKFPYMKKDLVAAVDNMLADDITKIMAMIPEETEQSASGHLVSGGIFEGMSDTGPFGYRREEGVDRGSGDPEWIVDKHRLEYDNVFNSLNPVNGKVMRTDAKTTMMKSKLPSFTLAKIYKLADVDKDGLLDADEFALMMHLIAVKLDGYDLPSELPEHLIPPSKQILQNELDVSKSK